MKNNKYLAHGMFYLLYIGSTISSHLKGDNERGLGGDLFVALVIAVIASFAYNWQLKKRDGFMAWLMAFGWPFILFYYMIHYLYIVPAKFVLRIFGSKNGGSSSSMTGGAPAQSRSSTTNQASSTPSVSSSTVDAPVTSTATPPIDWYGKAYAIQGAVVTKSDGSSMAYYKKCEACGYVDTTSHVQTSAPRKGEVFDTYFLCSKCQNNQRLKIGAG